MRLCGGLGPRALTLRHGIVAWVPAALTTSVTELRDSRVRLDVQVEPAEVRGSLERKAHQLGRELKLPGFRRGKVPVPLVIQRIGREAVLQEAVRDALSTWYLQAMENAGIVPVGDPQLDLGELPPEGQALEFSIEIGVLPKAQLGDYLGLEVPRREPAIDEQRIEAEIANIADRLARLRTAERPAALGDFVVVDYVAWLTDGAAPDEQPREGAPPAGEGRDQLVERGGGRVLAGFDQGLLGA